MKSKVLSFVGTVTTLADRTLGLASLLLKQQIHGEAETGCSKRDLQHVYTEEIFLS